ncbi:hypothetical protein Csa_010399 [Cucumis sativus]|uniref:Uncharacterized protein n=1 Tax=Cucumis sativus TaxID=3659 RepID=A0A0A0LAA7_CUCSA|nr:hypothetical protein Csa_010399 [Cucumis sativus]
MQTEIKALVIAGMDWYDFFKLDEGTMKVKRCMTDDKKNKISKKDPCGQSSCDHSFGNVRSNERQSEIGVKHLKFNNMEISKLIFIIHPVLELIMEGDSKGKTKTKENEAP